MLVDNKGLGKPYTFNNDEKSFAVWSKKTVSYFKSVYADAEMTLQIAAEETEPILFVKWQKNIIDVSDELLEEMDQQFHGALMALTDGESFDLVSGSGGHGFEAWRKLVRRWGPITVGRARNILRTIMNPGRAKLNDLQGAIERLEELFRRYCSRKRSDGSHPILDEEIRMASLESLLPENLEHHCQLNA